MQEINQGTERSVALMIGALIEDRLRSVIEQRISHLTPDEMADFFSDNGPASDFASRIKIAYALGGIPAWIWDDVNLIREIRNAFAHTRLQLSFADKELTDLCSVFHQKKEREHFISHFDTFKFVGISLWVQIYDPRFWKT